MKIVIDIPEELYAKVPTLINKGNIWIGNVLEAVKDGTPLEVQPTNVVSRDMTNKGCWREEEEYSYGLKSKKIWWDDGIVVESEDEE